MQVMSILIKLKLHNVTFRSKVKRVDLNPPVFVSCNESYYEKNTRNIS